MQLRNYVIVEFWLSGILEFWNYLIMELWMYLIIMELRMYEIMQLV